jgi:WD40 repeat protein
VSYSNHHFLAWDLSKTPPPRVREGEENGFAFHPDGRHLLMGKRDGSLWRYDLESPEQDPSLVVSLQPPVGDGLAFDPAGKRLAVIRAGKAEILDAQTGRVMLPIPESSVSDTPAWHPSGNYLALVSSKSFRDIYVWDLKRMTRMSVLKGSRSRDLRVAFTTDGDRLLSTGEEGLRLWDWRTGRQLLQHPGRSNLKLNPAGHLLIENENEFGLVALAAGQEYRSFVKQSAVEEQADYSEPIVHPGGRLLAVNMHEESQNQLRLFDLETGDELAAVPQTRWRNVFQADGAILTNGDQGLLRWPIHKADPKADPGHWQVGPPILLHPQSFVDMASDRNGDVIGQATGSGALLVRPGKGTLRLGPHRGAQHIAISPDGNYAATGINGGEEGVKLWDVKTRRLLKSFRAGSFSNGCFSPDGRWLAIHGSRGAQVVRVGTWETTFASDWAGDGAFSPDGSLFAASSRHRVRLLDPATGRELARLEGPSQATGWLAFTPDASKLVTVSGVDRAIYVWDLRAIRTQLADMGLDWDAPPYPQAKPTAPLPLRVTVDAGKAFIDPRTALALCSLRLGLNAFDFEAYFERGKAFGRLKQNQKAIADYSMALALMPLQHKSRGEALLRRSSNYRTLSLPVKARADLQEIAEQDLPLPPDAARYAAQQCDDLAWEYVTGPEKERDPHKALPLIRKAIKLTPEQPAYFKTLGVVHYRFGQYPEAVEWLERSLRESQGDAAAFDLFFLAMCHAKRGEPAKAKDCYDRAVRWVRENQNVINGHSSWSQELKNFQAEAEGVLGGTYP